MVSGLFDTPIGKIRICEEQGRISGVTLEEKRAVISKEIVCSPVNEKDAELLTENHCMAKAVQELTEYFLGVRKDFTVPLQLKGTEFQMRVWEALCQISYGTVCSYQDIAERIGNRKAVRAVGGANHRNPIMILVPCHRVIASDGTLGGYGGGLDVKAFLLELEQIKC